MRKIGGNNVPKKFSQEELENIISDYKNGLKLYKLSEKYNRKPEVILAKLRTLGIYKNLNHRWNQSEIILLKEKYPNSSWEELLQLLSRHDKESIIKKASDLKIARDIAFWSDSDIAILKKSYENKLNSNEIVKLLNNKFTISSILTKANNLGFIKSKKWTQDELNIMKKYYSTIPLDDLCNLLPNRKKIP